TGKKIEFAAFWVCKRGNEKIFEIFMKRFRNFKVLYFNVQEKLNKYEGFSDFLIKVAENGDVDLSENYNDKYIISSFKKEFRNKFIIYILQRPLTLKHAKLFVSQTLFDFERLPQIIARHKACN